MEPEPPGAVFFLPGAGADPSRSEPESAPNLGHPEPEPPKKRGGSATRVNIKQDNLIKQIFN